MTVNVINVINVIEQYLRSYETMSGWWLGHPSEKYEFVNWDDNRNPINMGK